MRARPIGKIARASRWCRRNPAWAVIAGLLLILAVVGPIVTASQVSLRLAVEAERQQTVNERDTALYNLYVAHMQQAHNDWQQGHTDRMIDLINSHRPSADRPDFRGWEWHYLNSLTSKDVATLPHSSPTREDALSWSPDGRYLAVFGQTMSIWDVPSRKRVSTFDGKVFLFDLEPSPVAWSPDGRRLACGRNHNVEIWDPIKGEMLKVVGKFPHLIFDIVWSPDGNYIAAGGNGVNSSDNVVRIWHVQKGGDPSLLPGQVEMVWSLGWHPHGRFLAVGDTYRGRLEIWDVHDQELLKSVVAHRRAVTAVEWSPNGDLLATASWDGTVKVWDPKTWLTTTVIAAHKGHVESICWSPDGKWLASSGTDNLVKVWDARTGQLENKLGGHRSCVYAVTWSPKGNLLASGDEQGMVKLWRPFDRQASVSVDGARRNVAWSPDGRWIVAPRSDGGIGVFDPRSGRQVRELSRVSPPTFNDRSRCAWSADGSRIAAVTGDGMRGTLGMWDARSGSSLWSYPYAHGTNEVLNTAWPVRSVSFHPRDRRLATTGFDGSVRIWDRESREMLHMIEGLKFSGSVLWSPNGQSLAHANLYGALKVWNAENWEVLHDLRVDNAGREDEGQYHIAWSPDGERLAGGFARGQIVVWDMKTGKEFSFPGHAGGIRTVSWSPDGRRLASGSRDQTARVWDGGTGRELIAFDVGATVVTVAWSPDGHRLAVAPEDVSVQIFDSTWSYENTK